MPYLQPDLMVGKSFHVATALYQHVQPALDRWIPLTLSPAHR